jgi:hypothetical protein
MPEKLPFDAATREELEAATKTAMAGGIETTPFWNEFEQELSKNAIQEDTVSKPTVEAK